MLTSGVACLDGNWDAKGSSGKTAAGCSAWALFCAPERRSVAESATVTLQAVAAGAERRSATVAVTAVCVGSSGKTAAGCSAWALFCAPERLSVAESVTVTLQAVAAGGRATLCCGCSHRNLCSLLADLCSNSCDSKWLGRAMDRFHVSHTRLPLSLQSALFLGRGCLCLDTWGALSPPGVARER